MDVTEWVRRKGGLARTGALARAGYGRRTLERALAIGALRRIHRGWVALPGADPQLVAAARSNVVLTCLTQAKALGLWVLEDGRVHVAAPAHSGRAPEGAMVHWARPLVPRHPDVLVDPIENVLVAVAACRPFEEALAVWESALRTQKAEIETLARLPLPLSARRVLESAEVWSDSGLETFVVPRLRWLGLPLRRQVWIAGHRVDLLIGDRLALQIDGAHHVGAQREADIAHDAQLRLLGYTVFRVGYRQVIERWSEVQELIMRAVAQRLHLIRP